MRHEERVAGSIASGSRSSSAVTVPASSRSPSRSARTSKTRPSSPVYVPAYSAALAIAVGSGRHATAGQRVARERGADLGERRARKGALAALAVLQDHDTEAFVRGETANSAV